MSFGHGLNADFYFSGSDISAYLTEVDPNFEREMAEMAHLGDTWKSNLAGLRVGSFSASGDYDVTLDAAVWTAFDSNTATACIYYPEGTGTGIKYTFDAFVSSFKPGPANTSDAVKYSFELTMTGNVTRSSA
jgi:hypothetical protein